MQQPQYLNPLAASEPIDQNEGGTANHQFSGTFDAPRPAKLGVVVQHIDPNAARKPLASAMG